jgi:hypothetical protein
MRNSVRNPPEWLHFDQPTAPPFRSKEQTVASQPRRKATSKSPSKPTNALVDCHGLLRFGPSSLSPRLCARQPDQPPLRARHGGIRRRPRPVGRSCGRRRQVSGCSLGVGVSLSICECGLVWYSACAGFGFVSMCASVSDACEVFDEMLVCLCTVGSRRRTGCGRAA